MQDVYTCVCKVTANLLMQFASLQHMKLISLISSKFTHGWRSYRCNRCNFARIFCFTVYNKAFESLIVSILNILPDSCGSDQLKGTLSFQRVEGG